MDFATFSNEMLRSATTLEASTGEVTKGVVLIVLKELIDATPVDTGLARSSWKIGRTEITDIDRVRNRTKIKLDKKGGGAKAVAKLALSGLGDIKDDQPLILRNDAAHIGLLDEGRSSQAAAGFIDRTIQATLRKLNAVIQPPLAKPTTVTGSDVKSAVETSFSEAATTLNNFVAEV